MASEVVMPRLGWSAASATLVAWLKHDGDVVRAGDIIATVADDKANVDIEVLDSGILRIPPDSPEPGVDVPIGRIIAYLVQPGEPLPFAAREPSAEGTGEPAGATALPAPADDAARAGAPLPSTDFPELPAAASDHAEHRPPDLVAATTPRVSPRARRVARELGVEWSGLHGSGASGRIVERDIRHALVPASEAIPPVHAIEATAAAVLAAAPSAAPPSSPAPLPTTPAYPSPQTQLAAAAALPSEPETRASTAPTASHAVADVTVPFAGIRRVIASRLRDSLQATLPVTLTTDADATELVLLRNQFKRDRAGSDHAVPTYSDLFVKIVAVSLQQHPDMNTSIDGDHIARHAAVHIGVAVDSERGLLVPVIRDVQRRSLQEIAEETFRLIASARAGRLPADALVGSTFTLTNLGMFEIDAFSPIIDLPNCAILGIGRIHARPVVVDEESDVVVVRRMVALSLTFDHRIVDGAAAARFLQRIKHHVERPTVSLLQ